MSISGLTGYKDTDREILLALSDKDLIKTCSLNKYLFRSVCDDNFFYRKLSRSYPDTLKDFNKEKDKTYKQYYLKVVYDVAKLLEDFKYTYISGNPKTQYEILRKVSQIIRIGINNSKTEFLVNYQQLLIEASKQGEIELVKEAIKKGADIHASNNFALRSASGNGHLDIVKYLVSQEADIHALADQALRWASENGHLEVVKYLVSLGANIHIDDEYALKYAGAGGHVDVVKYLVSLGANIHIDNDAALRLASANGQLEVVKYLVSQGADVHVNNDEALRLAQEYGYPEVVRYLSGL